MQKKEKMTIYQPKNATIEIAKAFERLIPQLNPASRVPNQEELQQVIDSKNTILFLGEENGEIIGTISLVFYQIPTGNKAWIEDVIVDEKVRGKGYGKLLMIHALDFAKSNGYTKINLTSNPTRIAANKMYQDLGFKQYITNMYRMDV